MRARSALAEASAAPQLLRCYSVLVKLLFICSVPPNSNASELETLARSSVWIFPTAPPRALGLGSCSNTGAATEQHTISTGFGMNRARERVRDDSALVGDISSAVSSALGLERTNKTLGRQVVIAVSLLCFDERYSYRFVQRKAQRRNHLTCDGGRLEAVIQCLEVLVHRRAAVGVL